MDFVNKVVNKMQRESRRRPAVPRFVLATRALTPAQASCPAHAGVKHPAITNHLASTPRNHADPTDKEPIEHPAHHGASLEHHNPPDGMLARMFSPETTKQIQSQGNNGKGMELGYVNSLPYSGPPCPFRR